MKPETLTALKASIQHLEELSNATSLDDVSITSESCALCGLFNTPLMEENEVCIGCPVYEHTGLRRCRQTPWGNVYWSLQEFRFFKGLADDLPEFLIHAKKELVFLRSLLPTDGQ